MANSFDFYCNTKIFFGCGKRFLINDMLQGENWEKIGLVIDHNLAKLPIINELLSNIQNNNRQVILAQNPISEPTYDSIDELRQAFVGRAAQGLQAIIGVGGGSTLDMAKAMAVLVHNPKPAIEYRGFNKMTEPVLPIIAIPTTAGSGSEVTPNASFIDSHAKKKLGINGEAVRPCYAILDPELTLSCPPDATISAATDSMVHAVEAFVARKTNPMARLFAREGFRQVFAALPGLIHESDNLELRTGVMYGAFLSGIALMHSGTGPAAALSYPLGVRYGVPHGLGGAVFLPHVMEHNIKSGYADYADFYDLVAPGTEAPREVKAGKFLEKMFDLWSRLKIPQNLQFCGYQGTPAQLEEFVRETMELKGALDQNPVTFEATEVQQILQKLTGG